MPSTILRGQLNTVNSDTGPMSARTRCAYVDKRSGGDKQVPVSRGAAMT